MSNPRGASRHTIPWRPAAGEIIVNPEDPWNVNGSWDEPAAPPVDEPRDLSGVPLPGRIKDPRLGMRNPELYCRRLQAIYGDYELDTGRPYMDAKPLMGKANAQQQQQEQQQQQQQQHQRAVREQVMATPKPILQNNPRSRAPVDLSKSWPNSVSRAKGPQSLTDSLSMKENTNKKIEPRRHISKTSVPSLNKNYGAATGKTTSTLGGRSQPTIGMSNGWPKPVPRAKGAPKAPLAVRSTQLSPVKENLNKNSEPRRTSYSTTVPSLFQGDGTATSKLGARYEPVLTELDEHVTEPAATDEILELCDRSDGGDSSEDEEQVLFTGRGL